MPGHCQSTCIVPSLSQLALYIRSVEEQVAPVELKLTTLFWVRISNPALQLAQMMAPSMGQFAPVAATPSGPALVQPAFNTQQRQ